MTKILPLSQERDELKIRLGQYVQGFNEAKVYDSVEKFLLDKESEVKTQ